MKRRSFLTATLAALSLLVAAPTAAQKGPTIVLLVRHAETQPDGTPDPALSEAGRLTAGRVAAMLADIDLESVHSTPYRRTMGTAGAVAASQGLEVQEYDPRAPAGLIERLRGAGGAHVVVGHSNTTPALVEALGGEAGPPIMEAEHDRLYVAVLDDDGVETLRLRVPGAGAGAVPIAADPDDVEDIDSILAALYDVISGPAGEPRDWDRMRSLFYAGAQLIPVQRTPDGRTVHRGLSVEDYIGMVGPRLEEMGFREREIGRRVDRFGDVAQVFSAYEGHREGQAEPVARGINSIQLIHDGERWWITGIAWSPERPDLPIPPEYESEGR